MKILDDIKAKREAAPEYTHLAIVSIEGKSSQLGLCNNKIPSAPNVLAIFKPGEGDLAEYITRMNPRTVEAMVNVIELGIAYKRIQDQWGYDPKTVNSNEHHTAWFDYGQALEALGRVDD